MQRRVQAYFLRFDESGLGPYMVPEIFESENQVSRSILYFKISSEDHYSDMDW